MKIKITTGDKVLFICLLALTIGIFFKAYANLKEGSVVLIEINNKEFGRFPLNKDKEIEVVGRLGTTVVKIEGGKVGIVKSPCPNKMCIKFGKIYHANRASVCLPNKIIIRILDEQDSTLDAILGGLIDGKINRKS